MECVFPKYCAICQRHSEEHICATCIKTSVADTPIQIQSIKTVHYLAPYQSPLGKSIRRAKQNGDRWVFEKIGAWMGRTAMTNPRFDARISIVPVPSPWNRKLRRGFNPSAVLANQVGRILRRPVVHGLSIRPGVRQAKLNRLRRAQNVRSRLRIRKQVPPRILLIDDVSTTGSTAQACAEALLEKGAREIFLYIPCVTHLDQKHLQSIPPHPNDDRPPEKGGCYVSRISRDNG